MTDATLFLNARVLTLDAANSECEAVAVVDGRIAAVGATRELRARAGARAREVDLGGGVLIPGFVDAHSHVGMVGELALHRVDLNPPPIGDVDSMALLVARLRERARATPTGDWVLGQGYDDTLLAEGRHPGRVDLDRVSTDHPVVAQHISGHLAGANSVALARAGLTRDSQPPPGGAFRRGDDGELDGVFEESGMFPVLQQVPRRAPGERLDAIEHAARCYASRGVTTAQNGATRAGELADLDAACAGGRVPIRVVAWPALAAMRKLESGALTLSAPQDRLRVGAVKLFADGSIQGYTGHLCQPYHVPRAGDAHDRGYAAMSRDELTAQVGEIYAAGRQVAVHVNGDAAIDDFLYAVARASEAHPQQDARPIAVHAQMTREDQLDEMLRLGVVPSFFCLHTFYWGDRHRDVFLGPERAARISPTRSAARRGLRFTIHTDAPVVPMDPLLLIWSAVNRVTTGGHVLGPEQCLTPLEALRATTIDAAWQLHVDDVCGSIEPGKHADFALLDRSPLEDPEAIRDVRVLETFVGGEAIPAATATATAPATRA